MRPKIIFLLNLPLALCVSAAAYAQQEELILSTYYPAPFGEYDELAAENLFCDRQIIGNMDVNGDGRFSTMDDIALVGNGNLLVEGRLGIGTAWPRCKLHIRGDTTTDTEMLTLQSNLWHTNDMVGIGWRSWVDSEAPLGKISVQGMGDASGDMRFYTREIGTATLTERLTIDGSTGNIGIGTGSPAFRLHVVGNEAYFHGNNAWGVSLLVHNASGGNTWRWVTGGATGDGNSPAGGMAIHRDGAFSPLQIKNDGTVFMNVGNVGIGTTAPSERLDVEGNIRTSGGIRYGDLQDYRLVYRDDFESSASGWTYGGRSTFAGATILGGYNLTSNTSFYKDYNLSGIPHTEVMVRFTYYAIDTWDSEWAWVRVGDGGVWNRTIQMNDAGRVNVGGWSYPDGIYFGEVRISHTANTVRVTVGSTLDQGPADESFGVDNVEVWVR